jgi:hypothetical protein
MMDHTRDIDPSPLILDAAQSRTSQSLLNITPHVEHPLHLPPSLPQPCITSPGPRAEYKVHQPVQRDQQNAIMEEYERKRIEAQKAR